MAFYHNGKVKPNHRIDAKKLMPHEDQKIEVGFEEYMMSMVGK